MHGPGMLGLSLQAASALNRHLTHSLLCSASSWQRLRH